MFHPLQEELDTLSIEDVEKKLNELNHKYSQAMRFGNKDLLTQLATFVTIYRNELTARHLKQLEEQEDDLEQLINVD